MSHTYAPAHAHDLRFLGISHTYAPAPATAHAYTNTTALAHAHEMHPCPRLVVSRVTHKWLMLLDIRPSHVLPLCACVTPMHPDPLNCAAGSNHVTCLC
ncbi:hypothetical protein O181_008607 [Austropuccinia psidii MF-1]|uniref:Uncharacterized protein n=1 Tax=Austropuccinia psidii MF-1 TaxID=1389203 RepID=A0A9Q3BP40_9BASI|nr:hypothetical protein [Austropuccinia psidii MF-1]